MSAYDAAVEIREAIQEQTKALAPTSNQVIQICPYRDSLMALTASGDLYQLDVTDGSWTYVSTP